MIYEFDTLDSQVGEIIVKIVLENGVPGTTVMSNKLLSDINISYDMQGSKLGAFKIGDVKAQLSDDNNTLWNNVFTPALFNNYRLRFQIEKTADGMVFDGLILEDSVIKSPREKVIDFNAVDQAIYYLQDQATEDVADAYPLMGSFYVEWIENMFDLADLVVSIDTASFPTLQKTVGEVDWEASFQDAYSEFLYLDIVNCSELLRAICEFFGGVLYYDGTGTYKFMNRKATVGIIAPTVIDIKKQYALNPLALPGVFYTGFRDTIFAGNKYSKNAYELKAFEGIAISADATPVGGGSPQPIDFKDKFIQQAFTDVYQPFFIDRTRPFYDLTVAEFVHPGQAVEYSGYYYYVVKARNKLLQFETDLSILQKESVIPS